MVIISAGTSFFANSKNNLDFLINLGPINSNYKKVVNKFCDIYVVVYLLYRIPPIYPHSSPFPYIPDIF